ncbi:hypothetical protein [Croceicoccus mobilis]|uniref:Transporter n=1 Tax=Croceicoccus mobilis TaxID=1703339 RepID=A0A916ZB89_9SPHN|nr:hypothetical protein [Croceicoccus mobilis]GGD85168.1 hypothetical protein GCM10010990_38960 [Croceicoccus mobilis]
MRIPTVLLLACIPATAFAQQAQPETGSEWEVSSGVEYESGDYGTGTGTDIEILSVPSRLGMTIGRVQMIAAIPYHRIEGPSDVIPGNVLGLPLLPQPQPEADSVTRNGWGDLELGATYALPVKAVNFSLSGSIKLPTAENDLGTGETDYTIGAEVSKAISDKIIPFASFSYTLPGSPEGISLQDRYAVTGGMATWLGRKTQLSASYRYGENPDAAVTDDQRVQLGLNQWVGSGLSIGVYGSAGLSKGAPDQSVGLRIGFALD